MIKKVLNRKGDVARTMNEGPFEVIRQEGNKISLYDYKREQVVKDVQVSRCRIFYEKEGQDPRSLGAALAGKSIVEAVLGHRGVSGKRKTVRDVKVLVKWADESAARWEP